MASGTELCNRFTKRDKALLQEIKSYCGVGKIYKPTQGWKIIQLRVQSIKDLIVIINYFYKYPLKKADFELWKQIFYIMVNQDHFTK